MQTGAHSPGDLSDFTESQPQGDGSFYTMCTEKKASDLCKDNKEPSVTYC